MQKSNFILKILYSLSLGFLLTISPQAHAMAPATVCALTAACAACELGFLWSYLPNDYKEQIRDLINEQKKPDHFLPTAIQKTNKDHQD